MILSLEDIKYDFDNMTGNIYNLESEIIAILTNCHNLQESDIVISRDINKANILKLYIEGTGIFNLVLAIDNNNNYEVVEVTNGEPTQTTQTETTEQTETNNKTIEDYANEINWKGVATREIQIDELPAYEIGETVNPGLSWSDGGQFRVENEGEYSVIFEIVESVEGHKVNYTNKQECYDLSCEFCEDEKEILINKDFIVTDFWEYDEEVQEARVFLKAK